MSHVVRRQVLEMRVAARDGVPGLQDELHHAVHGRLSAAMDAVLSRHSPPHEVVRLGRLELDLGRLPLADLEAELVRRTEAELEKALTQELAARREAQGADPPPGRVLTAAAARGEWLRVFLETGSLPWWAPEGPSSDPEVALTELLDAAPAEVARLVSSASPRAARRMTKQLSPALRRRLEALASPVGERSAGVPRLASRTAAEPPAAVETAAEPAAAAEPVAPPSRSRPTGTPPGPLSPPRWAEARGGGRGEDLAERSAQQVSVPRDREATPHPSPTADDGQEQPPAGAGKASRRAAPAQLLRGVAGVARPEPDTVDPDVEHAELAASSRSASPHFRSSGSPSPRPPSPGSPPGLDREPSLAAPGGGAPGSPGMEESGQEPTPRTERGEVAPSSRAAAGRPAARPRMEPGTPVRPELRDALDLDAGLRVDDAGLVLVAPYLKAYFATLGLTEDGAFRSAEAGERAVLLLRYLATGVAEAVEHHLPLHKLLCGWPFDEPVALVIEPSAEEARETGELLASVVANWPALGKTSVDGLRGAFLCREGRLTEGDTGWKLEIARTGWDVLLDRLPWSVGFVALPWMERPLFVEW